MQRYYHFVVPPWELGSFCLCLPSLHLQLIMLHTVAYFLNLIMSKLLESLFPMRTTLRTLFTKCTFQCKKMSVGGGKIYNWQPAHIQELQECTKLVLFTEEKKEETGKN